jgi:hypothetical protein
MILTRTGPRMSEWMQSAHERFKALEIPLEILCDSYELVRGAVGNEWLEGQERKLAASGRKISDCHPLFRDLTSPADTAIIEICELGIYLKHFMRDPALPAVLDDLRSDKYESTFFELAMAYRWSQCGGNVSLQPPTARGVADFAAELHGKPYVIEASIFPADVMETPRFRTASVIMDATKVATDRDVAVAVKVVVREYPEGDWQGRLRAGVRDSCAKLLAMSDSAATVREDLGFADIEVEVIGPGTDPVPSPGWDLCTRGVTKPKPPGEPNYRVVTLPDVKEFARVFLRLPPSEDDPFRRIAEKIKKEARQLRGIGDPRVVILDVSGVAQDVLELAMEPLRESLTKLMRTTPELACVWLMSRGWSTALRFQYRGVYAPNADSIYQVPASFLKELGMFEWRRDFLAGRDLEPTGYEEAMSEFDRRSIHPS